MTTKWVAGWVMGENLMVALHTVATQLLPASDINPTQSTTVTLTLSWPPDTLTVIVQACTLDIGMLLMLQVLPQHLHTAACMEEDHMAQLHLGMGQ